MFLPNWVGDSVMATPTLRALREHFGSRARLIGILKPYVAAVYAGTPWLDEYWHYDRGHCPSELSMLALLKRLRRGQFDKLILLTNSLSTAALAWLSGTPERIGYDRYARGCFLTHSLTPPRAGKELVPISAVDYYLQLAEAMGCRDLSRRVELRTTAEEEASAQQVWQALKLPPAGRLIVMNTGGAYGVAKHWPVHSFATLAQRLVQQDDATVLVLCGPSEQQTAREIVERAGHERVKSLAGQPLSLGLTKACVQRSTLMVTTDSGPRHLAAAFNVPAVTLFGPTDPRWSTNYNPREICVRLDLPCSPCAKRACPLGHHDCMRKLTDEMVLHTVRQLLP
ncbi:MAG: lipopolysaccharide heptosyltransferase II, partial [Pirellulaceae bacterium]